MKTLSLHKVQRQSRVPASLLSEAFQAILEKLGPEKTMRVWQILVVPGGDYMHMRPRLFVGKDSKAFDKEIEKFNRS